MGLDGKPGIRENPRKRIRRDKNIENKIVASFHLSKKTKKLMGVTVYIGL